MFVIRRVYTITNLAKKFDHNFVQVFLITPSRRVLQEVDKVLKGGVFFPFIGSLCV